MQRIILTALAGLILTSGATAQDEKRTATVAEAIAVVSRPQRGFGGLSPFELQTFYRLANLANYDRGFFYKYADADRPAWKSLLENADADIYARMCAATMLADADPTARQFLETHARSSNLRHRYNAAQAIASHVGGDPAKTWGIDLLLELIASGSLDGSGITSSPRAGPEAFPLGDRNDIMMTPIDAICRQFGFMKLREAIPALIGILERQPQFSGAAFALGEIGDPIAAPTLMKLLAERRGDQDRLMESLAELQHKEAVPILVERLHEDAPELDAWRKIYILEALLKLDDQRAVKPIEQFIAGTVDERLRAVAKRVLILLKSENPVPELLSLLETETYEPQKADLIRALAKHQDQTVTDTLDKLARSSDSAFLRREAINGLQTIGTREALLSLASLLEVKFAPDLKSEWGWKGIPDFSFFFPERIQGALKAQTQQDFGSKRSQWDAWIQENLQPGQRASRSSAR